MYSRPFLSLLIALICSLLTINSFSQTIIYVNNSASGLNNGSSWPNAFLSLHDALSTASTNDEIWIASGTYKPTTDTNKDSSFISKDKSLKIYGGFAGTETVVGQRNINANPTLLNGDIAIIGDSTDNSNVLLKINNATSLFLIDGLTFEWTAPSLNDTGYGGPISLTNSNNVVIKNCRFRHNFGVNVSCVGVNLFYNSNAVIDSCLFTEIYQGIIISVGDANTLEIKNSNFLNNLNTGLSAINVKDSANVKIDNCLIQNNTFYTFLNQMGSYKNLEITNDSSVYIYNSKFLNNKFNYTAFLGSYGNQLFKKCIFTNNNTSFLFNIGTGDKKNISVDSSQFDLNLLSSFLFNLISNNLSIQNTEFSSNVLNGGLADLIWVAAKNTILFNKLTIENNVGLQLLYISGGYKKAELLNSSIINNSLTSAEYNGFFGDSTIFENLNFEGNTKIGWQIPGSVFLKIKDSNFDGNTAPFSILSLSGSSNATILNCSIDENTISGGSALLNAGGTLMNLMNSTFDNNVLTNSGLYYIAGPPSTINECSFSNNILNGSNQILCLNGGNCIISKCAYTKNSIISGDLLLFSGSDFNMNECNVDSNVILNTTPGNGFLFCSGKLTLRKTNIRKNTITKNFGIRLVGTSTLVDECLINNNSISGIGQYLFSSLNQCTIKNTSFNTNTISQSNGLDLQGNLDTLSNCTFENNIVSNSGILLNATGSNRFSKCSFKNNKTSTASMIKLFGTFNKISECLFEKNISTSTTGVIHNNTNCNIEKSIFSYNEATNGGAIYNLDSLFILSSRFNYNGIITGNGGAIYNTGYLRAVNSIYYRNKGVQGSAILNNNKCININLTIVDNADYGIYNKGTTYTNTNTNCIFYQNKTGSYFNESGGVYSVLNSIIQTPDLNAINSIVKNPMLDLELKLMVHSPAYNRGKLDTTGFYLPSTDYFSNTRIFGDTVDIGACELQELSYHLKYDTIRGTVFQGSSTNCNYNSIVNTPVFGVPIKILPDNVYTNSDFNGNYKFTVDTGVYSVTQIPLKQFENRIVPNCPTGNNYSNIHLSNYGIDSAGLNFGYSKKIDCYNLSIDLNAPPNKRVCTSSFVHIDINNSGNLDVNDVKLRYTYPANFTIKGASMPYTAISSNEIEFNFPVIPKESKYVLSILDSVNCNFANFNLFNSSFGPFMNPLHVIYKAAIDRKYTCQISDLWDRSDLGILHWCTGSNLIVRVKNFGIGGMQDSTFVNVFQEDKVIFTKKIKLAFNESIDMTLPFKKSMSVQVFQTNHHPVGLYTSIQLDSNCTQPIPSSFVPSYVYYNPQESIKYVTLRNSYDPNEKSVIPKGYGEKHYTLPGETHYYTIQFQNNGNDTAYQVVVTDTLSDLLDLSSFEALGSSHPYTYEITGKGKPVLKWTFKDINLVDSATNYSGSQGFVSFRIKQVPTIVEGDIIYNKANIYFDYNEPVITNETFNEIKLIPYEVDYSLGAGITSALVASTTESIEDKGGYQALLYPDPLNESATLKLNPLFNNYPYSLAISDMNGKETRVEQVERNEHIIKKEKLKEGMYFYRLLDQNGTPLLVGKFVIQ